MINWISIRDPVLLNLLNLLGKTDKMLGTASDLVFYPNSFNKINSIIQEHSYKIFYVFFYLQLALLIVENQERHYVNEFVGEKSQHVNKIDYKM